MNLTIEWLKVKPDDILNYFMGKNGCVYCLPYGFGDDFCYVVAIARELRDKGEPAYGCESTQAIMKGEKK